jgi:hypothetical protein
MTKIAALAAISLSLSATRLVAAEHDAMAIYYSNTLHDTRSNGTQSWFLFNADHSFRSTGQDGKTMTGTWSVNAQGETCISMGGATDTPPRCAKLNAAKVGDGWDREGPNGNEHFVLEAGRR